MIKRFKQISCSISEHGRTWSENPKAAPSSATLVSMCRDLIQGFEELMIENDVARQPKIKPLQWNGSVAPFAFGMYEIYLGAISARWHASLFDSAGLTLWQTDPDNPFETMEEAIAAAEQHHKTFVNSLLS